MTASPSAARVQPSTALRRLDEFPWIVQQECEQHHVQFGRLRSVLSLASRAGGPKTLMGTRDRRQSPRSFLHALWRKRKALLITDTELRLMARAAIIGDSSHPVNGNSTPAASGTPSAL